MIEMKLEKRNLIVELGPEEVRQRAELAAEASGEAQELERKATKLAEEAKATKKNAELKAKDAARLLEIYRAREEQQLVDCSVEYHDSTNDVVVVRCDTFAIVERRKPTQDDLNIINAKRQEALPFTGSRKEKKGGALVAMPSATKAAEPAPEGKA